MVLFVNQQGYSNTNGPVQYQVVPNQPMFGNRAITTLAEGTIFEYDLITPYGVNSIVSNAAQTTRLMVGWNLTVALSLLTDQAMTLRIYARLGVTSTYTQIDTSPMAIALNAKVQTFTIGPIATSFIRGTLQAGTNTTVEYHSRLLENA